MSKNEMIAMLLAGGQGSRLGVLTKKIAKPAVAFGGMYRIIDFPLSNCVNSGVYNVGVLTQYEPLRLNQHIGIGMPWDLDRRDGGVTILAPHVKGGGESGEWFMGTANAIYQNINYIDNCDTEYVLILSGDHIYKMDYSKMLDFHKKKGSAATIAVLEVTYEEASRFGIMNTNEDDSVYEFEEKPKTPKNNLASMGIYIFTWSKLKKALVEDSKIHIDSDFGNHIIPKMLDEGESLFAYRFKDYWKDVGTIESYWQANMELTETLPSFNLYDDFWKIYTNTNHQPPQYIGSNAVMQKSIISDGCEIYGTVINSVLSPQVIVEEGAIIKDSIVMSGCVIKKDAVLDRVVVDENCVIGEGTKIGIGEDVVNEMYPNIYNTGITVLGEQSTVPDYVEIGKNCVIYGQTEKSDYPQDKLQSGVSLIKEEVAL